MNYWERLEIYAVLLVASMYVIAFSLTAICIFSKRRNNLLATKKNIGPNIEIPVAWSNAVKESLSVRKAGTGLYDVFIKNKHAGNSEESK